MPEHPPRPFIQFADHELSAVEKVHRWDKMPEPKVNQAAKALQNQNGKPMRELTGYPTEEGVFMLPEWAQHQIIKIGQRRGVRDLIPRGNSAHEVCFCTAELRKPDGQLITKTIALKTFNDSTAAIKEVQINHEVLNRGFNSTRPVCVLIDQGRGYIITPARKDIMPLDTEPWHQFSFGSGTVRDHFLGRLKQISFLLADLHSRGINHSDAQIKNFWVTSKGHLEAFDWEAGRLYPNPPNNQDLAHMAVDDLRVLFKSVTGQYKESYIPLFNDSSTVNWQLFKEYFYDHYSYRLMEQWQKIGLLNEDFIESILRAEEELKYELDIS